MSMARIKTHCMCLEKYEGNIVATTRILKPGKSYDEVAIGRVVTSPTVRGMGMGKQLMEESMKFVQLHFGKVPVRISAQTYLLKYYKSFGFIETGKEYLEDNIPHLEMLYSLSLVEIDCLVLDRLNVLPV